MSGKRFRTVLFGFKKADVYNYICELDESTAKRIAEKDAEIASLKEDNASMRAQHESIVSVLSFAERSAKDIVSSAMKDADELRSTADREINEQKVKFNREMEIKKREIRSNFEVENAKLNKIREEVEDMRLKSLEAIKRFEAELSEIEKVEKSHIELIDSIGAGVDKMPKPFGDAIRDIRVRTVAAKEAEKADNAETEYEDMELDVDGLLADDVKDTEAEAFDEDDDDIPTIPSKRVVFSEEVRRKFQARPAFSSDDESDVM